MNIHEIPNFIQVSFQEEKNYILFDWTNFSVSLEEIQTIHHKAFETAVEKHCMYYIAETSRVKNILRPEVLDWFAKEWVPVLSAGGLKAVITVVPLFGLATLSTRDWQANVVSQIFQKNVRNLAEAEACIALLQQESRNS